MVKNRLNSYAKYAFLNAYPLNDDPTKTIFYKAGYSFFALNFVVKTNFHQTITVFRIFFQIEKNISNNFNYLSSHGWIKGIFMYLYDDGDGNMRHYR